MPQEEKRTLTADDWVRAALDALGEGGLAAVAVEPLAKRLGATKGSFYWHFKDRAALIEAVLVRWEQRDTQAVIDELDRLTDPAQRLRQLFTQVIEYAADGRDDLALLASVDQPAVAAAMSRVAERRIDYVATQLRLLGLPDSQAHLRASVAVSIYHGFNQLARIAPRTLPATEELVDAVISRLLNP
ncbi:TetR/AcrR family transcriptional regulator [Nocardia sp. NPDC058666]|uniref:TetR/AcrR family transcriptional regulator n=1 Tax=Nocardia sp. NPDC058666 TaxID=3346587 RepID=UPI00365873E0